MMVLGRRGVVSVDVKLIAQRSRNSGAEGRLEVRPGHELCARSPQFKLDKNYRRLLRQIYPFLDPRLIKKSRRKSVRQLERDPAHDGL